MLTKGELKGCGVVFRMSLIIPFSQNYLCINLKELEDKFKILQILGDLQYHPTILKLRIVTSTLFNSTHTKQIVD